VVFKTGIAQRGQLLTRRVRAFARLPLGSKAVFVPALILTPLYRLVAARRGVKSATSLAVRLGGSAVRESGPFDGSKTAEHVVLGVRAAAGALPVELVCLPRALTAWTILNRMRVPAVVRFGMDGASGFKTAHAWIEVSGHAVGEANEHIARMAEFERPILGVV
jgi:hypothetical protein